MSEWTDEDERKHDQSNLHDQSVFVRNAVDELKVALENVVGVAEALSECLEFPDKTKLVNALDVLREVTVAAYQETAPGVYKAMLPVGMRPFEDGEVVS